MAGIDSAVVNGVLEAHDHHLLLPSLLLQRPELRPNHLLVQSSRIRIKTVRITHQIVLRMVVLRAVKSVRLLHVWHRLKWWTATELRVEHHWMCVVRRHIVPLECCSRISSSVVLWHLMLLVAHHSESVTFRLVINTLASLEDRVLLATQVISGLITVQGIGQRVLRGDILASRRLHLNASQRSIIDSSASLHHHLIHLRVVAPETS